MHSRRRRRPLPRRRLRRRRHCFHPFHLSAVSERKFGRTHGKKKRREIEREEKLTTI